MSGMTRYSGLKRVLPSVLLALLLLNLLLFLLRASPNDSVPSSPVSLPRALSPSPTPDFSPTEQVTVRENDNEELLKTERRLNGRLAVLREGCGLEEKPSRTRAETLDKTAIARTEVLDKVRLSVCVVYKAGSTAWNYLMAHLLNNTVILESRKWYKMIDVLKPDLRRFWKITSSSEYTRVLMAREPLERLLSAFRDRIQDQSHYSHQARHYAPLIFHSVRGIRYHQRDLYHVNGTLRIVPTFSEFVKYLVKKVPQEYDPHWQPIHLLCAVCRANYTAIVHTETFQEDIHYIMKKTGLDTKVDEKLINTEKNKGRGNTQELLVAYYSTLDPPVLEQIARVYKKDFILLGYDPTNLLSRISPNVTIDWKG